MGIARLTYGPGGPVITGFALWITHAVDFPALRTRAQEMRGDPNQARGSVRKPCKCALARRWFFEPWKGDSLQPGVSVALPPVNG